MAATDQEASVLMACYDLEKSPPTYDFISFMLVCEMERIDRGLEKIDVEVIPGPEHGFRRDQLPPSVPERRKMRDRVLPGIAWALPSVRRFEILSERPQQSRSFGFGRRHYGFDRQVAAARRGIYPFRAIEAAPLYPGRYIAIHLREAEHWPGRNSAVEEWTKAAHRLHHDLGYEIVFVRDGANQKTPIDDFPLSVPSATFPGHRLWIAAGATLNLTTNHGPAWLLLHAGLPIIMFRVAAEGSGAPVTSRAFFESCGLVDQMPNARPQQRLVWEADQADVIVQRVKERLQPQV